MVWDDDTYSSYNSNGYNAVMAFKRARNGKEMELGNDGGESG